VGKSEKGAKSPCIQLAKANLQFSFMYLSYYHAFGDWA